MSGWLDYTKKVVGSAIASIAQELEQSVVDFNDAVQEIKASREEEQIYDSGSEEGRGCLSKREQLLARDSQELPKGTVTLSSHPDDQIIPASKRQIPLKSKSQVSQMSYLPYMSTWPTTCMPPTFITIQPQPLRSTRPGDGEGHNIDDSSVSYNSNCRCHTEDFLRMRIGEKRPGRVVRASLSEYDMCHSAIDLDYDFSESPPDSRNFDRQTDMTSSSDLHHDPNCRELVPSNPSPENQVSPRWLGIFTFALAQVTSAVWMAIDHQPCPRPIFNRDLNHADDIQPGPCVRQKKSLCGKKQYSPMKLEVHRNHNSSEILRLQEDPHLLSPASNRSSLESFEVIDAPVVEEMPEVLSIYEDISDQSLTKVESRVESFAIVSNSAEEFRMTHSSAELIDFDFSNLLSCHNSLQNKDSFGHPIVENYFFPDRASSLDRCDCSEEVNCSVHMYVVGSDDGSSSFDILSDPGDEEFTVVDT